MSRRYKITFESTDYVPETGWKRFVYTVRTLLDEYKALVMATEAHMGKHPRSRIHNIIAVEKLEGEDPWEKDIVDRMEY